MKVKLTGSAIERSCPPPAGEVTASGRPITQRIYWDTDLPGFGLVVGARTRTFVVQKDVAGRSVRVTIGRYPTWTAEQARKRARELVVEMDRGVDPNARERERAEERRREEWQSYTLAQAVEEHVANMRAKDCAELSMDQIRSEIRRYLGDWLPRPLVAITRKDCVERHRKITTDHGPVSANRALRMMRACWNSARKLYAELPPHPVEGVTFNKQRRKRSPIAWGELPGWWEKVHAIENPVRRDLNLFLLFTGLRSADARTVRWEHVDFDRGTVHRPKPKGGEDRAFTVPLCRFLLAMLARRKMDNSVRFGDDGGWVFPTRDREGNIVPVAEAKEQRYAKGPDGRTLKRDGKPVKKGHLPSPHRLRDTFITACLEAGVGMFERKILVNHTLPSDDVTEGYQRPGDEHLRGCVEKVAKFLRAKAKVDEHGRALRAAGA